MINRVSNTDRRGGENINKARYYASEFTDAEIDALADTAEFYLEESGFSAMPTQDELKSLAMEGNTLLFAEWFRTL
jgi:hypothetical protein